MVLDLKRRKPSLFQECRVILAGGIFNRETAFMAALLGADAIQMGTAYLATQEIVETGALTALYQRMIVESRSGATVVSGQSTGLRVRSLKTPRVAAVLFLEREFAAGHEDELSFRAIIGEMTAGSLFAAARGVDRPSGRPLDEGACLERGQFTGQSLDLHDHRRGKKREVVLVGVARKALRGVPQRNACATWPRSDGAGPSARRFACCAAPERQGGRLWRARRCNTVTYIPPPACATGALPRRRERSRTGYLWAWHLSFRERPYQRTGKKAIGIRHHIYESVYLATTSGPFGPSRPRHHRVFSADCPGGADRRTRQRHLDPVRLHQ